MLGADVSCKKMNKSALIVDPQAMFLELLVPSLERQLTNFVFMTTTSVKEAQTILECLSFDVVISDIAGLEGATLSMIANTCKLSPKTKAVILTDEVSAIWTHRAMLAGVLGIVTKAANLAELVCAINAVLKGDKFLSPCIAEPYWDYITRKRHGDPLEVLCKRELEVFIQIGQGKTLKTIADNLGISSKTIAVHKHKIIKKTGIKTNSGIAQYCMASGLLTGGAQKIDSDTFTREITSRAA